MKIFVTSKVLGEHAPIYDDDPMPKIDYNQKYLLVFESGKTTMKVLKQLYLKNKDAYFQVKNLEYFIQRLGPLRNLEMEILDETSMSGKEYEGMYHACPSALRRYAVLEKEYRKKHNRPVAEIGLEISFCPRVLESIKTSMREPQMYKAGRLPCHRIYGLLEDGPKSYEALLEAVDQPALDGTLKSLIFSGIVGQKGSSFYINPILT